MSRVVAEARSWIGTAYVHQASARDSGTDCLGLVRGVWRAVQGAEPEEVPAYSRDWAEVEGAEVLLAAALRHFRPVARSRAFAPGEVLLFRMRQGAVAKHLGIVGDIGERRSFIHAYSGHGVVETSLSAPWVRRIVGRFDFPEHYEQEI